MTRLGRVELAAGYNQLLGQAVFASRSDRLLLRLICKSAHLSKCRSCLTPLIND